MSKASSCIRMLQILNSRGVIKVSEIADLLDTNPRNVIEYRKELEDAGYYITTIPGRYGGYKLDESIIIPSLKLTNMEKNCVLDSYKYCLSQKDFMGKDTLINAMSKIFSNLEIDNEKENLVSVNKVDIMTKDIEDKYKQIATAINEKTTILIEYEFLHGPKRKVEIDPYDLFIYDGEWRFFAWFHEKGEVWYFKLSRILSIEVLDKHFRVWKSYKIEDYLKDNVFSVNGDLFKIVLDAKGIRAKLFKEKTYGKNQKCVDLGNDVTRVELEMQKNYSTYNFILGCGDLVEVIEPVWLKEKIKEIAKNISNKYK